MPTCSAGFCGPLQLLKLALACRDPCSRFRLAATCCDDGIRLNNGLHRGMGRARNSTEELNEARGCEVARMSRIEGYQTKMTAGPPYHWQRVRWSSVTYIWGSRMRGLVIQAALVAGLEERDVGVWIQQRRAYHGGDRGRRTAMGRKARSGGVGGSRSRTNFKLHLSVYMKYKVHVCLLVYDGISCTDTYPGTQLVGSMMPSSLSRLKRSLPGIAGTWKFQHIRLGCRGQETHCHCAIHTYMHLPT